MRGWRLPLRIARRELFRAKGRTVLMLVMIALPVMGVTAADVLIQTQDVNSAESMDRRLGSVAAAKVSVWGGPVNAVEQSRDPEFGASSSGDSSQESLAEPDLPSILAALGGERRGIELVTTELFVGTDRGSTAAGVTAIDLHDPLSSGFLNLTRGRLPLDSTEVVINQALADRGPGLGDLIQATPPTYLAGVSARELKIVGIGESASTRSWEQLFVLPGVLNGLQDSGHSWLIDGGPVRWPEVRKLNALGAMVLSRAEIVDPSAEALAADQAFLYDSGIDQAILTVVVLVVVMALIEVVLLAGPAFAVGARRQARSLALVAASGGTPAQARRVVVATGVVIGLLGAIAGLFLGVGAAFAFEPVFQAHSGSWFGPFEIPWLHLVGIAGFGFISAMIAAVVPAWIASRQDVVAVLAGRRGDRKPSARSPLVGLALLLAGAGTAWAGTEQAATTSALFIGGSAILSVFGMILVVPVVVSGVARAGRWLPLSLRFAVRDASRHRTRTTPAVAAVAATVAGVVAFGIGVTSDEAQNRDSYQASMQIGQASLTAEVSMGPVPLWQEYIDAVERVAPGARPHRVLGIPYQDREGADQYISLRPTEGDRSSPIYLGNMGNTEVLAYRGELPWSATQVEDFPERAAIEVLEAGGVVVFTDGDQTVREARIRVIRYDETTGEEVAVATRKVRALGVNAYGQAPAVGIVPATLAQRLGVNAETVAVAFDGEVISKDQEKDLQEALSVLAVPAYLTVERGYETSQEAWIIQLVLGGLGAILMLGGTLTATFLALSDARPDLATLSAVGAAPRTRRGVAAGYALVVGGIGAVLGALVGIIPGIAATYPLTAPSWSNCYGEDCPPVTEHYLEFPWPLIGGLVVALPLLVAGVVWLFARSRLPLVARLS